MKQNLGATKRRVLALMLSAMMLFGLAIPVAAHSGPGHVRFQEGRNTVPGTPLFLLISAYTGGVREASEIIDGLSNATTGEEILSRIQSVIPSGVSATWSASYPFSLVPATTEAPGRVTGNIILSIQNQRTQIQFNSAIPMLESVAAAPAAAPVAPIAPIAFAEEVEVGDEE